MSLLLLVFSLTGQADVRLPKGEYYQDIDDLKVHVLGGDITVRRTWYKGRWFNNRAWEPLKFDKHTSLTFPNGVRTVHEYILGAERNGDSYEPAPYVVSNAENNTHCGHTTGNTTLDFEMTPEWIAACLERDFGMFNQVGYPYALNGQGSAFEVGETIVRTTTGYRWTNRNEDWIDYDPQGIIQAYGDKAGATATFTYDANGRRASVDDRLGNAIITYEYDAQDRVRFVRAEGNRSVEYRYEGDQLIEVIDVRGKSWRYTYNNTNPDNPPQLATTTDPANRITTITYTRTGKVASERLSDSEGNRREIRYDYSYDKNRKAFYVQIKGAMGEVKERFYDIDSVLVRKMINGQEIFLRESDLESGNIVHTLHDRRRQRTVKKYDAWKNLVKTTHPDGTFTTARYEPLSSQLNERIDELGRITDYEYHDNGLLQRRIEAVGTPRERITEYRYNAQNQLREKKRWGDADTQEAITSYTYNPRGLLETVTDPEGGVTRYEYNLRGDVTTLTDANR